MLQEAKTGAKLLTKNPLYLFYYYNITALYANQLSSNRVALSCILNAFIEGLNNSSKLPKYVLMIPDNDIILSTDFFNGGANKIFYETLEALFKQINKVIKRRHDDLLHKRPGSIASTFEPRFIWIKVINRPNTEINTKISESTILKSKFNSCLQDQVANEHYMHIMSLADFKYAKSTINYFNQDAQLNHDGKAQSEINTQMRQFECSETDLNPPKHNKPK